MCNFRVGQKVVCVDDGAGEVFGKRFLIKGAVYTIRAVASEYEADDEYFVRAGDGPLIWLAEIVGRGSGKDHPYGAFRFRPVVERKTDISIFKAMLNTTHETAGAE